MPAANWYYVVDGTRYGPVESLEIEQQIAEGNVTATSLVWREGLDGWEEAGNFFTFPEAGGAAVAPPPLEQEAYSPRRSYTPAEPAPRARPEIGGDGLYIGAPARGFLEAIGVCFRRYVGFSGRASRSEYWFFILFAFLGGIVASIADLVIFGSSLDDEASPLNGIFSLAIFLPMLAVTWRRLHDTDRSGWWFGAPMILGVLMGFVVGFLALSSGNLEQWTMVGVFLGLAMFIYYIMLIVFFCQRGTPGPNRFG